MNDSVEKTEGTPLARESTSSILELVQKEGVRSVRRKIEDRLDRQQEDIEFYIKTNQRPSELVIPTGCVWDAYSYLSDLVRNAKERVISWTMMGTSELLKSRM